MRTLAISRNGIEVKNATKLKINNVLIIIIITADYQLIKNMGTSHAFGHIFVACQKVLCIRSNNQGEYVYMEKYRAAFVNRPLGCVNGPITLTTLKYYV